MLKLPELIRDLLSSWDRNAFHVEACEPHMRIVFTDRMLIEKYGAVQVVDASSLLLVPPMLTPVEPISRLLKFYRYLAGFTRVAKCVTLLVLLDDCSPEGRDMLTAYTALSVNMEPGENTLELSVIISELLKCSKEVKSLSNRDVSSEEYIRYQELRERLSKLVSRGIQLSGGERQLLKAIRVVEEALAGGIQPAPEDMVKAVLGVEIDEHLKITRLSSTVKECGGSRAELYGRAIEALNAMHGHVYPVLTPEYVFLRDLPGVEGRAIVVDPDARRG
ncbi:hypothetical protein Desmu_0886 [Desulfurococcus mucosus DSM 2162]|uniref:Uncharacterized protein n=1 Tax=Desulfurococcus mucosus (strain ATCC 35584 / DSM 2162 / JCM 9187 / O7/1) TaxID=765177 RepID=E8R9L4_DESM0|nr:hypothetical protein Desmu_0886 [Desulfurococcus mucosus DSM 2162]